MLYWYPFFKTGKIMIIEVKNIAKAFGKKQVLSDVSFCAESGECIGILGGNGSGKSTLLSILAGVLKADGGSFLCEETDLLKGEKKRSELVGFVPQGTPLIEELTAYDNLLLWYSKKRMRKELEDGVLSMLGIADFLKIRVSKMSGGMKKRLSLGCAIAKDPTVLLLDEPMTALDLVCKNAIYSYLKEHKERGGILILVTHDVMELDLCDACYILKDGALTPFSYDGNVENLVENLT